MKTTTLLITTYNRPDYLKKCLASIERANIKDILVVDDCSTDPETIRLISKYPRIIKPKRTGICDSILIGLQRAFDNGAQVVINLDADAIIRNDFLERMLELHCLFPYELITGFHSITKNANGTDRHKIIHEGNAYCFKQSVGGINLLWTEKKFEYFKPVIKNAMQNNLNWDHQVSIHAGKILCAVPSLVEHIGIESAMGHTVEQPDIAADFKPIALNNVTLVCVDDDFKHAEEVMMKCMKEIEFGQKRLISSGIPFNIDSNDIHIASIDKLGSKEAYSKFIIKELHKYIDTDYALIVQHDGYVKNPEAWTNEFLNYDYIGAPWWYKDGKNVGNGGFSLRSKKLLELTAKMPITNFHPEDHIVCREMRPYLESQGIKFAPEALASKFSFEGYFQQGVWSGQFGFHGARAFRIPPDPRKQGFIINQFLGLGDILFLVPLIRHWMQQGHDIIWPIADEYFDIKRHFPDIQFVKKSDWPGVRYGDPNEHNHQWRYGLYRVKPLRWNKSKTLDEAMITKYSMYGLDFEMWRQLKWERDYSKENQLTEHLPKEYALICQPYGNVTDGGASNKCIDIPDNGMQKVYLGKSIGFTLLDWAAVIENASVIHAVSSSTLYLFEMLNLKAKEIHLYSRKGGQRDFEYIKPLIKKDYIFHL